MVLHRVGNARDLQWLLALAQLRVDVRHVGADRDGMVTSARTRSSAHVLDSARFGAHRHIFPVRVLEPRGRRRSRVQTGQKLDVDWLRHVNGRAGHYEHRVLHMPPHRAVFPMGAADGGRERQKHRDGVRDSVLHTRLANGIDWARAGQAFRPIVPQFLPVVHGVAAFYSQHREPAADELERLAQPVD